MAAAVTLTTGRPDSCPVKKAVVTKKTIPVRILRTNKREQAPTVGTCSLLFVITSYPYSYYILEGLYLNLIN